MLQEDREALTREQEAGEEGEAEGERLWQEVRRV